MLPAFLLGLLLLLLFFSALITPLPLAALVVAINLLTQHFDWNPGVDLGDTSLYAFDLLFSLIALVVLARLQLGARLTRLQYAWLIIAVYFFVQFLRSIFSFGLLPAGNDYRLHFFLSVGTLYFSSFPAERYISRVQELWIAATWVICLNVLFLWTYDPWDSILSKLFTDFRFYDYWRVMGASSSFWLGQSVLMIMVAWLGGGWWPRIASLFFFSTMVILQHRSVWVSFLAGVMFMLVKDSRMRQLVLPMLLVGGAIILALISLLEGKGLEMTTSLTTAIEEPFDDRRSTLAWRAEGWHILVSRSLDAGPMTILFGNGFGTSYDRTIDRTEVKVTPHNFFIQTYLETGLIGMGMLLAFFLALMRKIYRMPQLSAHPLGQSGVLLALLGMDMVYFLVYAPGFEQGLLWGVMISLAGACPRREEKAT